MKYRTLLLDLPAILAKLLCYILDDRRTRIITGTYVRACFDLMCVVPQVNVLSSIFVHVHAWRSPLQLEALASYMLMTSTIIGYPGTSLVMAQRSKERTTKQQKSFGKSWKIKTNSKKITVIRLGSRKKEQITTNTDIYNTQNQSSVLGLKSNKSGYYSHIQRSKNYASNTFKTIPLS